MSDSKTIILSASECAFVARALRHALDSRRCLRMICEEDEDGASRAIKAAERFEAAAKS